MTRNLPALRTKILDQLPEFIKPRLAEFEAAIRAEEQAKANAEPDRLKIAAWDYWHASTPNDTPSGRAAWDALTAILGSYVEV